jgi:hypothetical protein
MRLRGRKEEGGTKRIATPDGGVDKAAAGGIAGLAGGGVAAEARERFPVYK